jgi:hypothetical protein
MKSGKPIFRLPRCVIEQLRRRRRRQVARRPDLDSMESRALLTGLAPHLATIVSPQHVESVPVDAPHHDQVFQVSYAVTHENAASESQVGISAESGSTAQGVDAMAPSMSPADATDDDSDDGDGDDGDGGDGDDGDGGDDIDDENDPPEP